MAVYNWYTSDAYIKSLDDAKKLVLPDGKKWHYTATAWIRTVRLSCTTTSTEHLERSIEYWYKDMKAIGLKVTSEWR